MTESGGIETVRLGLHERPIKENQVTGVDRVEPVAWTACRRFDAKRMSQ